MRYDDEEIHKEMMSLRDKENSYTAKQETGDSTKATGVGSSSSSRQWSGLKNPRIVRVSRTFGGKDRHSKVCTIKGLRDRRIRLSVPTAIQLYDLQDRLGLNQPSKVIDWLLDSTKNDIDKLPPLPMIPGTFTPFHQPPQFSSSSSSCIPSFLDANLILASRGKEDININSSQRIDVDDDGHAEDQQSLVAKLKYWESNMGMMRSRQKEVCDHQGGVGDHSTSHATNPQVSAQNFFPLASGSNNNPSYLPPPPTLLSNPMFNYYHWEPNSNNSSSLTQLGSLGLTSSQNDHQGHQSNSSPLPSSLSLSSGSQLFLYPSMPTTSLFPPQYTSFLNNNTHHQAENEHMRQLNRFHLSSLHNSSSSSLGLKSFPLSMSHHQPHLTQNEHDHENHQDKSDHGGLWKASTRD